MKIGIKDELQFELCLASDYSVGDVVIASGGKLFLIVNYADVDLNVDNLYCELETGKIYSSDVRFRTKTIDVKVVNDD